MGSRHLKKKSFSLILFLFQGWLLSKWFVFCSWGLGLLWSLSLLKETCCIGALNLSWWWLEFDSNLIHGQLAYLIAKLNSLLGHLPNQNVDKAWVAKERGIVFLWTDPCIPRLTKQNCLYYSKFCTSKCFCLQCGASDGLMARWWSGQQECSVFTSSSTLNIQNCTTKIRNNHITKH
jgi:hypothetical protein